MNSIQLMQRLARNLSIADSLNPPAEVMLDLLSAINGGLASFYREMPGIYKRTTLSGTLRAPRSLSLVFSAQYSRIVADDTFLLREQGCTVRMANGGSDNIVTSQNSLLDDYLGTDLAVAATLYSDAIPIQDVIERVIGHVRLYDGTQAAPTPLVRNDRLRGGHAWRRRHGESDGEDWYSPDCGLMSAIGRPEYYYLDPMGASQGAEPEFLLRVAPLPEKDYIVRLEAELSTQRFVFSDLTTARVIQVGDAYLDDILIPLCEAELVASRWWADKDGAKSVMDRAENALARKITKVPSEIAPVSNLIGTPAGY